MFNKILCPTDGSDHAYKALDLAIDMAKKYAAELVILHVSHGSENIEALPATSHYQKLVCEHPYNISFIDNPAMLDFFRDLKILSRD